MRARVGQSTTGRVLRGSLGNYLARIVSLGTWFVLTPFILHRLGQTHYGLWILVSSVVAYGFLLNFGIGRTITRFVARLTARGEADKAQSLIATMFRVYCGIGMLTAVLTAALAPVFPYIFQVPLEDRSLATLLVLAMGLQVGISFPCVTATAVLQGLHRYDLTGTIEAVGTLVGAAVTIAALMLGWGLAGMAFAMLPVTVASGLISAHLVRRLQPQLRVGWRGANQTHVREILSFSWALFVLELSDGLQRKTDEIVIGLFLPLGAITPYALARRLADLARNLVAQYQAVLLPIASEIHASDNLQRLQLLYLTATRLSLMVFLPIGLFLSIFAGPILTLWVGQTYAENAYLVVLLVLAGLSWVSMGPSGLVAQGMARHHLPAAVASITGIANLGCSIFLVQRFGLLGVALGTLLPALAELLAFRIPYVLRMLHIRPSELLVTSWLPAVVPLAPMSIVLILSRQYVGSQSVFALGGAAAVGFGVYAAVYAVFGAGEPERRLLRSLLPGYGVATSSR